MISQKDKAHCLKLMHAPSSRIRQYLMLAL